MAVADQNIHMFHISHSVDDTDNPTNLSFNHLQTLENIYEKPVNDCTMLDYDRVITCSRDPVIKMFDLTKGGTTESSIVAEFEGHEMAVSTIGTNYD